MLNGYAYKRALFTNLKKLHDRTAVIKADQFRVQTYLVPHVGPELVIQVFKAAWWDITLWGYGNGSWIKLRAHDYFLFLCVCEHQVLFQGK